MMMKLSTSSSAKPAKSTIAPSRPGAKAERMNLGAVAEKIVALSNAEDFPAHGEAVMMRFDQLRT